MLWFCTRVRDTSTEAHGVDGSMRKLDFCKRLAIKKCHCDLELGFGDRCQNAEPNRDELLSFFSRSFSKTGFCEVPKYVGFGDAFTNLPSNGECFRERLRGFLMALGLVQEPPQHIERMSVI